MKRALVIGSEAENPDFSDRNHPCAFSLAMRRRRCAFEARTVVLLASDLHADGQ
jgi:hypothetical protein